MFNDYIEDDYKREIQDKEVEHDLEKDFVYKQSHIDEVRMELNRGIQKVALSINEIL